MASKVTLRSQDGEEFVVAETVAMQSVTLNYMIQDDCAGDVIPVANVDGKTLSKIIEYATKHEEEKEEDGAIDNWDAEFIEVDIDTLYDLLLGANYLEIKGLLDLCVQKVADLITGKTAEEIRQIFNITNDFSPEEEEKIRAEHAWAFCDDKK